MGLPKKIGLELLDNNILNKIAGMIHGTTIAYDDTGLNQEINNLKLNKISRDELSAYFNKENEKITREMLSSNLLDAIDTAAGTSSESTKIEENNLGPNLASRLNDMSVNVDFLMESKDKINNMVSRFESIEETVDRLVTKTRELETYMDSIRSKNIVSGCFVNSEEELQGAIQRFESEIIDLKNNRVLKLKSISSDTVEIPVTWDTSNINTNARGVYIINGTFELSGNQLNLNNIVPQIFLNVGFGNTDTSSYTSPYVQSITTYNGSIELQTGTNVNVLKSELPKYVSLGIYDPNESDVNESVRIVPVTWDISNYDSSFSYMQLFMGSFTLPSEVTNPNNLIAIFPVTFSSETIVRPNNIKSITTSFESYALNIGQNIQTLDLPDSCEIMIFRDLEANINIYKEDGTYPITSSSGYINTLMINPVSKKIFFFDGKKVYDMTPGE